jgi:transcriptional regulator with XRE-family HTH domain
MPIQRKKPVIPPPEKLQSSVHEANILSGFGERVFKSRMEIGMTQHTLAKHLEKNRSSVAQWERGKNVPDIHTIEQAAVLLNTTPQWLAFGISDKPQTVMPDPRALGYALVPEIRVGRSPDEYDTLQKWGLPYQFLTSELGCPDPDALFVMKVEAPIGEYQVGDRVIVDRSSTRPSPPGIFLLWDGMACVLAKVGVVPGVTKSPTVRIENANGTFEIALDKTQLLGRVRGSFSRR